jgi:hypothetical protein
MVAAAPPVHRAAVEEEPAEAGHTAPHDEIVGVVRDLMRHTPSGVGLDALSNALRERGFRRPPGSPRLITRLRRIKELDVGRNGTIRLIEPGDAAAASPGGAAGDDDLVESATADAPDDASAGTGAAPRRRRRRGGRRRRGRRSGAASSAEVTEFESATAAPHTFD